MVFFIDRSLGRKKLAAALRAAGAVVEVHDDHFAPDAPDVEWLREVGARGWAVLTADKRIRYNNLERRALIGAGVQAFVLTSRAGPDTGQIFVSALRKMERLCANHEGQAFIAKVSRGPDVRLLTKE